MATKAEIFSNKLRATDKYKQWREEVIKEQGRVCQICGSCSKIQVHHEKFFLHLVIDFLNRYSNLDVFKDTEELLDCAEWDESLWDVNIGVCLCQDCHELEHNSIFDEEL